MTLGLLAICALLIAALVYEKRHAARERAELLQRIQAPEAAVAAHDRDVRPRVPARVVAPGDDAGMIAAAAERAAARGEEPEPAE